MTLIPDFGPSRTMCPGPHAIPTPTAPISDPSDEKVSPFVADDDFPTTPRD